MQLIEVKKEDKPYWDVQDLKRILSHHPNV